MSDCPCFKNYIPKYQRVKGSEVCNLCFQMVHQSDERSDNAAAAKC